MRVAGYKCEISWEIRGDGADSWQVVLGVGFGEVGMKRGEVSLQVREGQLASVTFSDGRFRQNMGPPLYPSHTKPPGERR